MDSKENSWESRKLFLSTLTYGLIQNNIVQISIYRVLSVIEGLTFTFFAFTTLLYVEQLMHNEHDEEKEEIIHFGDSDNLFDYLLELINPQLKYLCIGNFVFLLLFLLGLYYIGIKSKKKRMNELKNSETVQQIYSLLLVAFRTILYPYSLIFIFQGLKTFIGSLRQDYVSALMVVLNFLSAIIFLQLLIFSQKLYKLCYPNKKIPWSLPNSSQELYYIISKLYLIVILQLKHNSTWLIAEISVGLCLWLFSCYLEIHHVNEFEVTLIYIKLFFNFVTLTIQTQTILTCIFRNGSSNNIINVAVYSFFATLLWVFYRKRNIQDYWERLKVNKLRYESQYEVALQHLIELTQNCFKNQQVDQENYIEIITLLDFHKDQCDNVDCICRQHLDYIELIKRFVCLKRNIFPASKEQYSLVKTSFKSKSYLLVTNIINLSPIRCRKRLSNEIKQQDYEQQIQNLINEKETKNDQTINLDDSITKLEALKNQKRHLIQQQQVCQVFIKSFVEMIVRKIKKKFPNSFRIHSISNYFYMHVYNKPHICITELRGFDLHRPTIFEKVLQFTNEMFMIDLFLQKQHEEQFAKKDQLVVDGFFYVRVNKLFDSFTEKIEQVSSSTIDFWNGFRDEDIKYEQQRKIGENIVETIKDLEEIFNEIDEVKQDKDPKIYYWFGLVQLYVLNNEVAYKQYIMKMKQIINLKKILEQTSVANKFSEECAVIMADGKQLIQLKGLYVNQVGMNFLGYQPSELKNFSVKTVQPFLVSSNHNTFVKNYQNTGESPFINKLIVQFVKAKDDSIHPCEVLAKFYFSHRFGYTFIAVIQPISQMIPFRNALTYDTSNLIFMTIDHIKGKIYEVSPNFIKILNILGFDEISTAKELGLLEKDRCLTDLIQDFDFQDYVSKRLHRYENKQKLEDVFTLDLFSFKDFQSSTTDDCFNLNNNGQFLIKVRMSLYDECYGNQAVWMSVVILEIIDQQHANHAFNDQLRNDSSQDIGTDFLDESEQNTQAEGSMPSMASAYSIESCSSNEKVDYLSRSTSQVNMKTPKSMKIVLNLLILVFLTTLALSTTTLIIGRSMYTRMTEYVEIMRKSYERANELSSNVLVMRNLLNIANGYEQNHNEFLDDRFLYYQQFQGNLIQNLSEVQNFLDKPNLFDTFSDEFKDKLSQKVVQLSYLNVYNQIVTQNSSLSIATNIFINKLNLVSQYGRSQLIGHLPIQTLTPDNSESHLPSEEEQNLYFIMQNGIDEIRSSTEELNLQIYEEILNSMDNQKGILQFTVILSLLLTLIVGFIVSPILASKENRKFRAFELFLQIPYAKLEMYINNCSEVQLKDPLAAQKEQRQKPKNKFVSLHDLLQNSMKSVFVERIGPNPNSIEIEASESHSSSEEQNSDSDSNEGEGNSDVESLGKPQGRENLMMKVRKSIFVQLRKENFINKIPKASNSFNADMQSQLEKVIQKDQEKYNQPKTLSIRKSQVQIQLPQTQGPSQNSQVTLITEEHHQSYRDKEQTTPQKMLQSPTKEFEMEEEVLDEEELRQKHLPNKINSLRKKAFKARLKIIVFLMLYELLISCYFISIFLLDMQKIELSIQSAQALNLIFQKEPCMTKTFQFIKENQITNFDLTLVENPEIIGSSHYLEKCLNKEEQYLELRKNMPQCLQYSQDFLEQLETDQLCSYLYPKKDSERYQFCSQSLHGFLEKGLSNTIALINSHLQRIDQAFKNAKKDQIRDSNFIINQLQSDFSINIMDTKEFVLSDIFYQIREQIEISYNRYFNKMEIRDLCVYIGFVTVISISVFLFLQIAYKRFKRNIWNTNHILKMIPQDSLQPQEYLNVVKFFSKEF